MDIRWASQPREIGMSTCEICASFPFDRLPSEEEDALPHQPNLAALHQSTKTCPFCKLIYWALGCSFGIGGGMTTFAAATKFPSGAEHKSTWIDCNNNTMGMRGMENGAAYYDFSKSSVMPDMREPYFRDPMTMVEDPSVVRPWLFGNFWESIFDDWPLQLIGLGVRMGVGPGIEDAVGNEKEIQFRGSFLRLRTDYGKLSDGSGYPRKTSNIRFFRGLNIQRVKRWLHTCDNQHQCGGENALQPLPTRVLFTTPDSDIVQLYETRGEQAVYIALSHCWGSSHRITTTKENIQSHKRGIPINQLPKTFRQAIRLAQQLRFAYVWIDSLCIVQDDPLDWEHEASRMGEVYANAYLTIAALASTDDSSGCFPDPQVRADTQYVSPDVRATGRRCYPWAAPLLQQQAFYRNGPLERTFELRYLFGVWKCQTGEFEGSMLYFTPEWMPSSSTSKPKIYAVGLFATSFDPLADEPLSKRGWTFQERLLSSRTIHFGSQQMYWECESFVRAEDGAILQREFMTAGYLAEARPVPIVDQPPNTSESESEPPKRPFPDPWHRLVQEYSSRQITFEKDKLPALAGAARTVAAAWGDTYYAGLWRSTIIEDLYWSIELHQLSHYCDDPQHDAAMPPPTKSQVTYPKEYRAPTWSWASLDGRVEYKPLQNSIRAKCMDISVTPTGRDPFGGVARGSITLEAPLYRLLPKDPDPKDAKFTRSHPFTTDVQVLDEKSSYTGWANFDTLPDYPSFAIFLDHVHALILKSVPEKVNTYTRIGTIWFPERVPLVQSTLETPKVPTEDMQKLSVSLEDPGQAEDEAGGKKVRAWKKWVTENAPGKSSERPRSLEGAKDGQQSSAIDQSLSSRIESPQFMNASIQIVVIV